MQSEKGLKSTSFAGRLEWIMKNFNLKPMSLADKTGIPMSTMHRYLTTESLPNYETLAKIATAFPDINESWLLLGYGDPKKSVSSSNEILELNLRHAQEKISFMENQIHLYKKLLEKSDTELETNLNKLKKYIDHIETLKNLNQEKA